jgi:hypothetical protein
MNTKTVIILFVLIASFAMVYLVIDISSAPMKQEIKSQELQTEPAFCNDASNRYYYDDINCIE